MANYFLHLFLLAFLLAAVHTYPNSNMTLHRERRANPSHCPPLPPWDGGAGFGCLRHNCWAYCGVGSQQSGQWCWTRKHTDQSRVSCETDDDCCPIWRCSSICSL